MSLSNLENILPESFSPLSRVWIYAADRALTSEQSAIAHQRMETFVQSWTAHGAPVKGIGIVLFDRFLVLAADETMARVSGCSTDSSVRMMQQLQLELGVDLFNRTLLSFYKDGEILTLPLTELPAAIESRKITPETLFFDHTVGNKEALEKDWLKPAKKSWLIHRFPALREEAIGF